MAADAALLAWAQAGGDRVAFRTYAWSRPTLSLGRAEPFGLTRLSTHHATLEDVFVSLTGRQLRDA